MLKDEERFKFHELSPGERGEVVKALAEALAGRDEVVLAVIFGSFIKSQTFRDVDVAIYTGYRVPYEEVEAYEDGVSKELEGGVNLPVDVCMLDYAPPWFKVRVLSGVTLVEKEPALAARLKFKALQEINDIKAKIRKASSKARANQQR